MDLEACIISMGQYLSVSSQMDGLMALHITCCLMDPFIEGRLKIMLLKILTGIMNLQSRV